MYLFSKTYLLATGIHVTTKTSAYLVCNSKLLVLTLWFIDAGDGNLNTTKAPATTTVAGTCYHCLSYSIGHEFASPTILPLDCPCARIYPQKLTRVALVIKLVTNYHDSD